MSQRRFIDLHTHTNASDGDFAPEDLVRLADRECLAALAVTDHDTIAALAPAQRAAEEFPQLRVIAGIEISARFPHGTLHLLGLGIDPACASFQAVLANLQDARAERNPRILARLRDLGMGLDMDDVRAEASGAGGEGDRILGRLHIAHAMLRKGYVHGTQEAFARYIGHDKPAYVDKERLAPAEAIAAIRQAGGLSVLAHPVHLDCPNRLQLEGVVRQLVRCGLEGIEVYHTDHNPVQTRIYLDLARRLDLAVTGGSDFHGHPKPHVRIGHPRVTLTAIGPKVVQRLMG
jgi:3',5'-nucleoside bisphosphate phosphatase